MSCMAAALSYLPSRSYMLGRSTSGFYRPGAEASRGTLMAGYQPVAPVAYQVILEPGIGQFREFESRRVHARINS